MNYSKPKSYLVGPQEKKYIYIISAYCSVLAALINANLKIMLLYEKIYMFLKQEDKDLIKT